MVVWDAVAQGAISFDAREIQSSTMGYVVENRLMRNTLVDWLYTQSSEETLSIMEETELEAMDTAHSLVKLCLSTAESQKIELQGDLVIGADGFDSMVRSLAGFEFVGWDYHQSAVVGTMNLVHSSDNNETAWQRFLPTGPIAMLPVRGKEIL
jgi:2-polyprenyl-6-methoxyphenol hydroxylase-like FAD-dependent oxidoreductase